MKMSPSPYWPGPVLKNRVDDFATSGEARTSNCCLASAAVMVCRLSPVALINSACYFRKGGNDLGVRSHIAFV